MAWASGSQPRVRPDCRLSSIQADDDTAATAMTIAAIILPKWVSWQSVSNSRIRIDHTSLTRSKAPDVSYSYGLHRRCSTITGVCEPFPEDQDCLAGKGSFCSMWRSVGFFMSFAVIIELATFVSYIVVLAGGKQYRDYGWKVVCSLLTVGSLAQCVAMAIVVSIHKISRCQRLIRSTQHELY